MTGRISLSRPVLAGNELKYVSECVESGWVSTASPLIGQFEQQIASCVGSPYAVACASGTAALHVALILVGVKPGDLVIVPSLTFIATINAVRYVGADPMFVGCDVHMNMEAQIVRDFCERECKHTSSGLLERSSGRRVAAIVPVHVFGNPCDMTALLEIASDYGLPIVEDAAEGLGSSWSAGDLKGRSVGTAGDFGAFSFNGNKIITTGGGGMLVTNDEALAAHARHLTTQAKSDTVRFVHDEVGFNYRLGALGAALGMAQLEQLDQFMSRKQSCHQRYREMLDGVSGLQLADPPSGTRPNYWMHTVLIDPEVCGVDREAMMAHLGSQGIETRPIWYPNHLQRPYSNCRAYRIERVMWFWERGLNIPSSSDLTDDDVDMVCRAIRGVCSN